MFLKDIGKPTLGQSSLKRHLSALKPRVRTSTRPAVLSLLASTGSFSGSGANATAYPLSIFSAPGRSRQI
jgi:hypothetical protein